MICYRKATLEDLETLWDHHIRENPDDPRYFRWKEQFIRDNVSGDAATFVIAADGNIVGEGTLLLHPGCRAIHGRTCLCDGKSTANINALRIRKSHEGQGYISSLMRVMEQYASTQGIQTLTIGVEAAETRNLGIYLHWGFDRFLMHEAEEGVLVLYYAKPILLNKNT